MEILEFLDSKAKDNFDMHFIAVMHYEEKHLPRSRNFNLFLIQLGKFKSKIKQVQYAEVN